MKIKPFSKKQLFLLSWWHNQNYLNSFDSIICDGSIRSGKTLCMSLSFIFWASSLFNNSSFAICGKTISSLSRNVISSLLPYLSSLGFSCRFISSKNIIHISYKNITNSFYLFGGKDESSASLIQGMTLSGVMLDEVALMPRSFVEQAIARCSISNSKFWFNCNPQHPFHWFYLEWIKKLDQKKSLYLHFTMEDNPSLSSSIIKRYSSLYSGSFFDRFILGKWTSSSGLVYPMFDPDLHVSPSLPSHFSKFFLSCDYGTVNPFSLGLWGESSGVWFRIKEFYHDSSASKIYKTDQQYYTDLEKFAYGYNISSIIIDPSASSFIQCIKQHGFFSVVPADNNVYQGIQNVSETLLSSSIKLHSSCLDSIREFSLYSWNDKSSSDSVKKAFDHAMDDIRYFVNTIIFSKQHYSNDNNFFVASYLR